MKGGNKMDKIIIGVIIFLAIVLGIFLVVTQTGGGEVVNPAVQLGGGACGR